MVMWNESAIFAPVSGRLAENSYEQTIINHLYLADGTHPAASLPASRCG
jgi:hypothetical protein